MDQWTQIFGALSLIAEHLIELHESRNDRNLFSTSDGYDNVLMRALELVDARVFYGDTLGFQYLPSVRPAANILVGWLASYFSFYHSQSMKPVRYLGFLKSLVRSHFSPTHRSKKYIKALENSDTHFCQVIESIKAKNLRVLINFGSLQSFWGLGETPILYAASKLLADKVEVNRTFEIQPEPLQIFSEKIGDVVDIPIPTSHIGPAPVNCRLISAQRRAGMVSQRPLRLSHSL